MSPINKIETLVVDDSTRMRGAIRHVLEGIPECDIVGEGTNGLEALELAHALNPKLVVMDINMPRMGGMDALRLLKRGLPAVHVVMISSVFEPEIREEALNLGAMDCLEKGSGLSKGLPTIISKLCQDLSRQVG